MWIVCARLKECSFIPYASDIRNTMMIVAAGGASGIFLTIAQWKPCSGITNIKG